MKFVQLLSLLSFCLLFSSILYSQDYSPWMLRAEAGPYSIHHDDKGFAPSLRLAYGWKRTAVFDIGIVQGFGEDHFTTFDAGFELHISPNHKFIPFAGIGAGLIHEPEFSSILLQLRLMFGSEINVAERINFRISRQLGGHLVEGGDGPSTYTLGLVYNFGKKHKQALGSL